MSTDETARNAREILQNERRALVRAAEAVIEKRFSRGRLAKPNKTQFSTLIGLCNEAACAEEIVNYLRYQAGRNEWEREFALAVIDGIKPSLSRLPDEPAVQRDAWKLYATYLTRAYVYQNAISQGRSS
ncbi:MAG: hypothetical protein QM820_08140 [Minicystis sp.]